MDPMDPDKWPNTTGPGPAPVSGKVTALMGAQTEGGPPPSEEYFRRRVWTGEALHHLHQLISRAEDLSMEDMEEVLWTLTPGGCQLPSMFRAEEEVMEEEAKNLAKELKQTKKYLMRQWRKKNPS